MGHLAYTVLLLCLASAFTSGSPLSGVVTTETYKASAVLDNDGNYLLFWKFNEKNITFEVHVKTRGFVGFGISTNGNMFPADVVVGWVKDGTPHFKDRHTVGHSPPLVDKTQSWHLLQAFENDFGTVLKFIRDIDTCDDADDEVIQEGTVRVIYAYHPDDPVSDDALVYHGVHRGTKSLSLLSESVRPTSMPTDIRYYEFLNQNFIVPANKTYYHCVGFQMPDIGGKHHMISYEPVVTKGNELHVHHILLYRCHGIASHYHMVQGTCYGHGRPLPQCTDVFIAWAIGGEAFYFPDNVGFPVGGQNDPTFYIMETHYDNPTQIAGLIDDSGLRIALTQQLRTDDIGMLEIGSEVNWRQIVPPGKPDFLSKSYCSETCLRKGLGEFNYQEVKVIAALQHAHLLGVGIKTRHFRNGVELKPLMNDPNYDFDFQEVRMLPKEVSIQPGDSFSVECTYDSSHRTGPTVGGLATTDEMCLSFLYYYPRMNLHQCISAPILTDTFGVSRRNQVLNQIYTLDWQDQHTVDGFMAKVAKSKHDHQCRGEQMQPRSSHETFMEHEPAHPYIAPNSTCSRGL